MTTDNTSPRAGDGETLSTQVLADALQQIAHSASNSRSQTRRIRWIEQRALCALRGEAYTEASFSLPKSAGPDTPEKLQKRMSHHIAIKYRLLEALRELEERAAESLDRRPEFLAAVERARLEIAHAESDLAAPRLPSPATAEGSQP